MNDLQVAIRTALQGFQAGLWTSLPGFVQSYDPVKMTVSVQPTIKIPVRDQQGKWTNQTLPVCPDVLVQFPSAGGFTLSFPIKAGDEGLIVFASRCLDAWWQQGGVQPQAELRMHDLSDGCFIPGLFSQPNVLPNLSTDNVQLRNKDGTVYVEIAEDGKITLKPGTDGVHVDGNVAVTGNITATGEITRGLGGADQVTLGLHRHPGNNTPPTPGT